MRWTGNSCAGLFRSSHVFLNLAVQVTDSPSLFRVLQLMNLTDSRLAQGGCEKLELAMLSFFEQFRKIYVGDQVGGPINYCILALLILTSMFCGFRCKRTPKFTRDCPKFWV